MERAQFKERQKLLNRIYIEHDVPAFREFIREMATERKELAEYVEKPESVLSDLMHTAKSQLIYLGEAWQESRNVIRQKKFWEAKPMSEWPEHIALAFKIQSKMPMCITCDYFRDTPYDMDPCMHLGDSCGYVLPSLPPTLSKIGPIRV